MTICLYILPGMVYLLCTGDYMIVYTAWYGISVTYSDYMLVYTAWYGISVTYGDYMLVYTGMVRLLCTVTI